MPRVTLEFDRDLNTGVLGRSDDLNEAVWLRLKIAAVQFDADARAREGRIELDWAAAIVAARSVAGLRSQYSFVLEAVGEARELLARDQIERSRLRQLRTAVPRVGPDIREQLELVGWDSAKRTLKSHQVDDLQILTALDHGANFSVPGAGKTTVGFALHLLIRRPGMRLLVVCPKNALGAWSTIVQEVMRAGLPDGLSRPFVRLDGSDEDVSSTLATTTPFLVVTYDRVVRSPLLFRNWLSLNDVHLILDESHRIKAGNLSLRGRVLSSFRSLASRRDILSGTPVPNSAEDLATQFDFLYPTQRYGQRIRSGARPRDVISGLYVRTTKSRLDIPPMDPPVFEGVEMSSAQAAFYSWLRSKTLPALRKALIDRNVARPVRGSVMRLLQASSNARWAATRTFEDALTIGDVPDELLRSVIDEGDSRKLIRAAALARSLVNDGRRALIWTGFRDNVTRLVEMLSDVGVTFIDGSVPTGDVEDVETREGRIAAFHRDDGPRVLVANPAACSEGISLHHACHDAIYLDRTYNGGHYLQSLDRIHRLGLTPGTRTRVLILQSICDDRETVDHSVSRRLYQKLVQMNDILDDNDIRELAIAEEEGEGADLARDVDLDDVRDLIEQIESGRYASVEEG